MECSFCLPLCIPFKCAGPQVFNMPRVHMHIPCTSSCLHPFAGALQQMQCAPLQCSLKCEIKSLPPISPAPRLSLLWLHSRPARAPGSALNSPLLQSTASQTKCSRRVAAYAKLLPLPPCPSTAGCTCTWQAVALSFRNSTALCVLFCTWMRARTRGATGCGCADCTRCCRTEGKLQGRGRAGQDETQGRGRVHEMRVLLLNNTRRLLQFSHLAVAHQVATLQAERSPARSSHLVAKCQRALRQMPQSVLDLFFNKLTMRGEFMNK